MASLLEGTTRRGTLLLVPALLLAMDERAGEAWLKPRHWSGGTLGFIGAFVG